MRQWTRVWTTYTWWLPEIDLAKCFYQTATGLSLDKQLRDKARDVVLAVFGKIRGIFAKHAPDPPPVYNEPYFHGATPSYPSVYSFKTLNDLAYYQAYKDIMENLQTYNQFPTTETLATIAGEAVDPYRRLDNFRLKPLRLYPVYNPKKSLPTGTNLFRTITSPRSSSNERIGVGTDSNFKQIDGDDDKKKTHENSIKIITVHNNDLIRSNSSRNNNTSSAVTIITAISGNALNKRGTTDFVDESGGNDSKSGVANDSYYKNSINSNNLMLSGRNTRHKRQYEYQKLGETEPHYGYLPDNTINEYTGPLDVSQFTTPPPRFGPTFISTHEKWVDYFEHLILAKFGLVDQIKQPDTYLACAQSYTFVILLRLVDSIVGRI